MMPLIDVRPLQVFDSTGGSRLAQGARVRIALRDHAAELGTADTLAVDRVRLRAELLDHDGREPSIAAVGPDGDVGVDGAEERTGRDLIVEAELDRDDMLTVRVADGGPTHLRLTVVGYREWDQSDYVDESEVPPGTLPQHEPTSAEIHPGEAAGLSIADTDGPRGSAPRVLPLEGSADVGEYTADVDVLTDDDPEVLAAVADWERAADEET